MLQISEIMSKARKTNTVIPAFNIPYLPMMAPVVRALRDEGTFGQIAVARLEWIKFKSGSIESVAEEYYRVGEQTVTSLHLDHVPVIDEDMIRVDYMSDISRALEAGYSSVMIDASRLTLEKNILAVKEVVDLAHKKNVPVEAELGAVMGHETGPLPDYEELFSSGRGFTDPDEAALMIGKTKLDWLSVAVGSVHGAISAARAKKKISARLNIDWLGKLDERLGVPLVLHGGSGIPVSYLKESFQHGIAKLNIATDIRQPYEKLMDESIEKAQAAVYDEMIEIIGKLGIKGSAEVLTGN
jgi:fructose-bisphosphate aldolase class II